MKKRKHKYCYQCKFCIYNMAAGLSCKNECTDIIEIYPTKKACEQFEYDEKYIISNTGFKRRRTK